MSLRPFGYQKFLERVHRRQLLLRLVEGAGVGALCGCAAVLPLVLIALWRGMPAVQFAVAGPLIGGMAGVFWGVLTRPNRLVAALEADRQLGWDDLLSSAVAIQAPCSSDPWAEAVRAYADSKCAGISPSRVILHRLGVRAWGGIGLAAAFVLALGSIPTFVSPSRAGNREELSANPLAVLSDQSPPTVGTGDVPRRGATQAEPEDASRTNGPDTKSIPGTTLETVADQASNRSNVSNDPTGSGVGASQSKTANPAKPLDVQGGTEASRTGVNGRPGGGAGQSSPEASRTGDASGQSAGAADHMRKLTPPWQSSNWPDDSRRANAAVESGRIPDSYRDVIRGYFNPTVR